MLNEWLIPDSISTWTLLLEVGTAALIVIVAAMILSGLADRLANERGLGKAFVGMLLLATVTSLPEVVAGAAAGAIGAVDLAFGAVYGSCSFNIVIIVIMNLVFAGGGSVLRAAQPAQLLSSSFGIVLITLSLLAIPMVEMFERRPGVQQGIEIAMCIAIVGTYLFCMRLVYRFEKRELMATPLQERIPPSAATIPRIALVALITIAAAWWLTRTGDVLAEHPIEALGGRALGKTAVGLIFLAVASSLPEIATSIAAVRINNLEMALGNVFGSNMFNILVLPVTKVAAYTNGDPLLMSGADFTPNVNLLAGLLPVLLTAVAFGGIVYRTQRRVLRLGFDSAVLMVIYLAGMVAILASD